MESIQSAWDFSDPKGSEERFRVLLAESPSDERTEILTQIARAQGLRREFDAARQTLQLARNERELSTRGRIRLALESGRVENSAGNKDLAKPLFAEALSLAQAAGEENLAVDAAHMLGIVEPGEAGLAWNFRAIAMAKQASDPIARAWFGSLANNTGWSLHDLGRFDEALDLFERALQFRMGQGNAETIRIARWCVARCLRSLGRVEEALQRQRELESGEHDGYVEEEIGECLICLRQSDEAAPYFAAAYQRLSTDPWLQAQEPGRLERLRLLGGSS